MRKFMVVTTVFAGLAVLFAVSMVTSASASSGSDSVAAWAAGDSVTGGPDHPGRPGRPGGPGGPGRPGPGPHPTGEPGEPRPTREPGEPGNGLMCHDMAKAVHAACPCNGPDGAGWADHDAYVLCVTNAANAAVAGGGNQECATKLIERATKSKVGTEGFECKPIGARPGGPGHPGRPGGPRGEHPKPEPTAQP